MFSTNNIVAPLNTVLAVGSNGYVTATDTMLNISTYGCGILPSTISTLEGEIVSTSLILSSATWSSVVSFQLASTTRNLTSTINANLATFSTFSTNVFGPYSTSTGALISTNYSTLNGQFISYVVLDKVTYDEFTSSLSSVFSTINVLSTSDGIAISTTAGNVGDITELSTSLNDAYICTGIEFIGLSNAYTNQFKPLAADYSSFSTHFAEYSTTIGAVIGVTGGLGPPGPEGPQGPIGPGIGSTGTAYSDYLYWDPDSGNFLADSLKVHLGAESGASGQSDYTVAIGYVAGQILQSERSIAIGYQAGNQNQSFDSIAIGNSAGFINQGSSSIAIGINAGATGQDELSVAIGGNAGETEQNQYAIAIGYQAGNYLQSTNSIAIGKNAGLENQNMNAVAVGAIAGASNQGSYSVAVGYGTANSFQNNFSVSLGAFAGANNQSTGAVAIGTVAGFNNQGEYAIAIGYAAGSNIQSSQTIVLNATSDTTITAVSTNALYIHPISEYINPARYYLSYNPEIKEVSYTCTLGIDVPPSSILFYDGEKITGSDYLVYSEPPGKGGGGTVNVTGQIKTSGLITSGGLNLYGHSGNPFAGTPGTLWYNSNDGYLYLDNSIIGPTGTTLPDGTATSQYIYWDASSNDWLVGGFNVHLGDNAGLTDQDPDAIAIGTNAGYNSQNSNSIAIGTNAGSNNQGTFSVAIGYNCAQNNQDVGAISIGTNAGYTLQTSNSIAIGTNAGSNNQGGFSVAIGTNAGSNNQGGFSVAIGYNCAKNNQNYSAIAIGPSAGENSQALQAIAIGIQAGNNTQNSYAIAIGKAAGFDNQETNAVAIGNNAGYQGQQNYSIAIGYEAGKNALGAYSIAIGNQAGTVSVPDNTIVLNADSNLLDPVTSGLFINPITSQNTGGSNVLLYDTTTKEIRYDTSKTFVIDHPTNPSKYLVHACLEGPEAGVYYRGRATIAEGSSYVTIRLPEYVAAFATDFTVQATPIYSVAEPTVKGVTEVENGEFTLYGTPGSYFWLVHGLRQAINVEPDKDSVNVKGDGPYKWI